MGGPERSYQNPVGDAYPTNPPTSPSTPESNLGDVYPTSPPNSPPPPEPSLGDVYESVPGSELGAPQRVYPDFKQDEYPDVPGKDLGGKMRAYPPTEGDVYKTVPGKDLGSPDRAYLPADGDAYENVPGRDLGGPIREYPEPEGDAYEGVPGPDLGGKTRIYPRPEGDVYPAGGEPRETQQSFIEDVYSDDLFGSPETGNPSGISNSGASVYPSELGLVNSQQDSLNETGVYPDAPNPIQIDEISPRLYSQDFRPTELGSREILYPVENNLPGQFQPNPLDGTPSIYPSGVTPSIRGDIGKVYPKTAEDFVMELNRREPDPDLGNLKHEDRYNQSLGDFNPPEDDFIE